MKKLLFVVVTAFIFCNPAFSKEDKKGAVDHPLLTRYPGTYVDDYNYADYDQAQMIGSTLDGKKVFELVNVEGKLSQIEYRIKDQQLSVSQLFSKYKKSLSSLNAEFMVSCNGETECGATAKKFYNTVSKYPMLFSGDRIDFNNEFAILTAKFKHDEQTSHAMIVVSGYNDSRKIFQSIVTNTDLVDDQVVAGVIEGSPKSTVNTSIAQDKDGGADHPLLTRYPGAYINNYNYSDNDQAQMIGSSLVNKKAFDLVDTQGKVSQIEYRIEDQKLSAFQIISNYKKALSDLHAEFIVSCVGEQECGAKANKFYNTAAQHPALFGGDRINFGTRFGLITATVEQDGKMAHVMIVASSSTGDTKKVFQSIVSSDKELDKPEETASVVEENTEKVERSGDGLSQADIDKLISAAPTILKVMEESTKPLFENKEIRTAINNAMFEGNPYQVYPDVLVNEKEALAKIEKSALENKYDSYMEFAQIADRVHSVITVNTFMTASVSLRDSKEIKNVFEYINLNSTPSDEKTRLTGYLPDMYEKLNTNPADVPIVSKNFDKLQAIFSR